MECVASVGIRHCCSVENCHYRCSVGLCLTTVVLECVTTDCIVGKRHHCSVGMRHLCTVGMCHYCWNMSPRTVVFKFVTTAVVLECVVLGFVTINTAVLACVTTVVLECVTTVVLECVTTVVLK